MIWRPRARTGPPRQLDPGAAVNAARCNTRCGAAAAHAATPFSASHPPQWLYASDEGSLAALRAEVRASLDQARAFIALREAEAPGEWIAVQTFRAAQALLQVQADFVRKQHGRGLLTDGDLEELLEGINAKRTRLEVVGECCRRGRWR